jgi:peptide deformylase
VSEYPDQPHLVLYPDPVLRTQCTAVDVFDAALASFVEQMFQIMDKHHGVGLAAPQVGVAKRIFVTDHAAGDDESPSQRQVFINPTIEPLGETEHTYQEGCLSLPALYSNVSRPAAITISWQDVTGESHTATYDAEAGDFLATIVQHEFDHLNGVLFLDHLSPPALTMLRKKLKELEKKYKQQTGRLGKPVRR